MCSIVYFLPVPTLQQADNKNVLLLLVHCRYQWFWLATSVIWKMNELLDEIKVKTYQDSGEIGKHQTVPAIRNIHMRNVLWPLLMCIIPEAAWRCLSTITSTCIHLINFFSINAFSVCLSFVASRNRGPNHLRVQYM